MRIPSRGLFICKLNTNHSTIFTLAAKMLLLQDYGQISSINNWWVLQSLQILLLISEVAKSNDVTCGKRKVNLWWCGPGNYDRTFEHFVENIRKNLKLTRVHNDCEDDDWKWPRVLKPAATNGWPLPILNFWLWAAMVLRGTEWVNLPISCRNDSVMPHGPRRLL